MNSPQHHEQYTVETSDGLKLSMTRKNGSNTTGSVPVIMVHGAGANAGTDAGGRAGEVSTIGLARRLAQGLVRGRWRVGLVCGEGAGDWRECWRGAVMKLSTTCVRTLGRVRGRVRVAAGEMMSEGLGGWGRDLEGSCWWC